MDWLKERFLYGWSWVRVARMLIGVAAFVEAVRLHNTVLGALSGIIFIQGLLGIGCCGTTCAPQPPAYREELKETEFEEIKGGK
jgi:hypothetical protein